MKRRIVSLLLAVIMMFSMLIIPSGVKRIAADGGVGTSGTPSVKYKTFVQKEGWQSYVKDGEYSGTKGKGLRIEAIKICLKNAGNSSVKYATYVQKDGWHGEDRDGVMSGTLGQSKRLEAIKISLEGDIEQTHDIYYRVYAQRFGWLGWAKNGAASGTAGYGYRLEGIMIKLVKKGELPLSGQKSSFENKTKKSMSDCSISLTKKVYLADKKGVVPKLNVKNGSKVLTEGKDYKLVCENNCVPGYATVIVTGMGGYAGSVIKSYKLYGLKNEEIKLARGMSAKISLAAAFGKISKVTADNRALISVDSISGNEAVITAKTSGKTCLSVTADGLVMTCDVEAVDADSDYYRAFDKGYVDASWKLKNLDGTVSSKEYREALRGMIQILEPKMVKQFEKKVSDFDVPIDRGTAATMSYYAAVCIGADDKNNTFNSDRVGDERFWDRSEEVYNELFPEWRNGPVEAVEGHWNDEYTASRLWNIWHNSPYSDKQVIAFDVVAGSMRMTDPFTVEDAVCAVTRLYDSYAKDEGNVSIDDKKAVTVFEDVFTDDVMKKASAHDIDLDELPRLRGFVLKNGYGYGFTNLTARPADVERIARWGFSSVRLTCTYDTLFSPDCKTVDLNQFKILDSLIASAVENDIHLNILFISVPGRTRWQTEDFESGGDFDLFINPEKQELCRKIWQVMAERYKNVSNEYLSFMPFWEPMNFNLSTGAAYPEYTLEDQINTLDYLISSIREKSPNRIIVHEVRDHEGIIAKKYDNVLASENYCAEAYVYAEMTDAEGEDIDYNNHSMFKPEYPVTIYGVRKVIDKNNAIRIDGCLPAGTTVNLYLKEMKGSGSFTIKSKDKTYCTEKIEPAVYDTSYKLSHFYPYATSNKMISFMLDREEEYIDLACTGGQIEWSGMDVILPEEYAVERWYSKSQYDSFLEGGERRLTLEKRKTSTIVISPNMDDGGLHITIGGDVTYTTERIFNKADNETVDTFMCEQSKLNERTLLRFEDACFSLGTTQASMLRYYDDLLTTLDKYGMDWYSNDYDIVCGNDNRLAEADSRNYDGLPAVNLELLQLFQKYLD